jgi:hypothetical protein
MLSIVLSDPSYPWVRNPSTSQTWWASLGVSSSIVMVLDHLIYDWSTVGCTCQPGLHFRAKMQPEPMSQGAEWVWAGMWSIAAGFRPWPKGVDSRCSWAKGSPSCQLLLGHSFPWFAEFDQMMWALVFSAWWVLMNVTKMYLKNGWGHRSIPLKECWGLRVQASDFPWDTVVCMVMMSARIGCSRTPGKQPHSCHRGQWREATDHMPLFHFTGIFWPMQTQP